MNRMNIYPYISITRPINSILSGITPIIAYIIAGGTHLDVAIPLFFIVMTICGAGNVINDYFDRDIDAINRPDRPIPSGTISSKNAVIWAIFLFCIGVAISIFFTNLWGILIAVINSILLIVYSLKLKRIAYIGNVLVAYLAGSTFILGWICSNTDDLLLTSTQIGSLWVIVPLFGITFFGTLAREILKDIEDIDGDDVGGNAKTLPMIIGIRMSCINAIIMVICATLISIIPYMRWGLFYLILVVIFDIYIVYVVYRSLFCKNSQELIKLVTTTKMKIGMFCVLFLFLGMEIMYKCL
ncbi:MAG TPA: UbiA family prenyltransferase [Methanocorpusculum sp.]|nr:UbiA family prenyltransferase [Methanocorpusculum sp.]